MRLRRALALSAVLAVAWGTNAALQAGNAAFQTGNAHYARGELEEARDAYHACLREQPERTDCATNLASVLIDLGPENEALAEALYRRVLAIDENHADAAALAEMLRRLNEMPVPTIARVQGPAYGGAVGLVSCCDLAVGGSRASFCLSEVRIGLIPATISPYVIGAIGARAARRYFLTAEVFDAAAASDLGLLTLATDDDSIDGDLLLGVYAVPCEHEHALDERGVLGAIRGVIRHATLT